MMCVSGEREGEGERGYDVWIRHSGIYSSPSDVLFMYMYLQLTQHLVHRLQLERAFTILTLNM